jgi:hypothetical protein
MGNLPRPPAGTDDYALPPAWETLVRDFTFSTPYDGEFVTRAVAWTYAPAPTIAPLSPPPAAQPVAWADNTTKRYAVGNVTWVQHHAVP